jgi:DNA repair exonuclease SbcCD ATPase subunit
MFRAIWRWMRAIGYLLTGRINKASETLRSNPMVMAATYDQIIQDKTRQINLYKDAIGKMVAQQEEKRAKLRQLTEDVQKLEKLKAGAAAKAKAIAQRLGSKEACEKDPEFVRCQSAYKDFSSTLAEKESHAKDLEIEVEQRGKDIANHETQIKSILRDLGKIKEEKHDAIADVIAAKQEQDIGDMLTGLGENRSAQELQELREMRKAAKAKAKVSSKLANLDSKREEEEFLASVESSEANKEFDALMDFTEKNDAQSVTIEHKLPEN